MSIIKIEDSSVYTNIQNTSDKIDSIQIYKEKENIVELPQDKEFKCKFKIRFI